MLSLCVHFSSIISTLNQKLFHSNFHYQGRKYVLCNLSSGFEMLHFAVVYRFIALVRHIVSCYMVSQLLVYFELASKVVLPVLVATFKYSDLCLCLVVFGTFCTRESSPRSFLQAYAVFQFSPPQICVF